MKKENRFMRVLRRYGVVAMSVVAVVVIAMVVTFNVKPAVEEKTDPVSTEVVEFGLPMNNAVVVKDYADDHLQFNKSLNRWEIHLSVDLASENSKVYAVCDGVVTKIDSNSLDGYVVEIVHDDGFASVYGSLGEVTNLKVGDKVTRGQNIGIAEKTAANEAADGAHLHFTLLKNGVEIDPNNYLDLQNK